MPDAGSVPGLFDGGHLWVQEFPDGAPLRFQLQENGRIRFGTGERVLKDDDVPIAYRHAVRHVRANLDRARLREAVDDVESVVFFGFAMHRQSVEYNYEQTPSVLGVHVYDADHGRFLPPDGVEGVFERVGLEPVNTFEKEVRASDFDPDDAAFPASPWRDGAAAGLLVRNKTGDRGKLLNPELPVEVEPSPEPLETTAADLAGRYASDDRIARTATRLGDDGHVAFETLFEAVFEAILREIHGRLTHGQTTVETDAFRSEVAARTRRYLDESA